MAIWKRGLIGTGLLLVGIMVGRATAPGPLLSVPLHSEPIAHTSLKPVTRSCEATVYLPLADNHGKPFAETYWQEALTALVVQFGGATLGEAREGYWLDAQQRVRREQVRPVIVSFAPERLEEFRLLVRDLGKRLGQEAMYIRFDEPRVDVVPVEVEAATH